MIDDQKYPRWAMLGCIAVLPFLVYAPAFWIGFLNDDVSNIEIALRHADRGFLSLFSAAGLDGRYFRPLVNLTFVVDHALWGWNPAGFRLTNLVLHAINTLLVFLMTQRLFQSRSLALTASLVFGVLPIHELSILWIPGRTDLLCSAFYLGSLVAFLDYAERKTMPFLVASVALSALALLSKEMAFSLPLIIGLISLKAGSGSPGQMRWLRAFKSSLPFFATSVLFLAVRWAGLDNNLVLGDQGLHGYVNFSRLVQNAASYAGLLAIPAGHYEIEMFLSAHPGYFLLLSWLLIIFAIVMLWRYRAALEETLFCAGWVLITLIPVMRLMMRWYLYIPSVGFCIGLSLVIRHFTREKTGLLFPLIAALWILYGSLCFARTIDWVRTGRLAETLLLQIRQEANLRSNVDTLTFVTIPSRLKSTHIFHLGFESTVTHLLGRQDIVVSFWPKIVMDDRGTVVRASFDETSHRIVVSIDTLGYLLLDADELITKRVVPAPGMNFKASGIAVEFLRINESKRVTQFSFATDYPVSRNLFFFNGTDFIRLR